MRRIQCRKLPLASRISIALLFLAATSSRGDAIDDLVVSEMQRQHSPAIAVSVVKSGRELKVKGYGLANVELDVPANDSTFFQTASMGKQFTATLVVLLVRDGKIRLDEPVTRYLPNVPSSWGGITVRRLLSHTSGLARTDPAIDLRKDYTEDELLRSAYAVPLVTPPGERFQYSNLGYQVLGVLCSKVGGKFWGDQMQERIFAPLSMQSRVISERDIIPGRAAGYIRFNGQLENQGWVAPSQNTTADGSLYVSARDMAIWSRALDKALLLTVDEEDTMWTHVALNDGTHAEYGFGWELASDQGHLIVRHRGDWQGFTSYILRLPEEQLTISILMNRANGQPQALAERIAARLSRWFRDPHVHGISWKSARHTAMYLSGSMDDWQTKSSFAQIEPNLLQAKVFLQTGMQQFKITGSEVGAMILGARIDEAVVHIDQPQELELRGDDLFLDVSEPGEYTFELDLRNSHAPTLTVRSHVTMDRRFGK